MNEDALMSVKETAKYMHMSQGKVYRMINTPELKFPYVQIGRNLMIPRKQVDQWIEESLGKRLSVNTR